jgi:hypothetical protein
MARIDNEALNNDFWAWVAGLNPTFKEDELMRSRILEGLHRELWTWITQTGEPNKYNWLRWKHNGGDIDYDLIKNSCFACAATLRDSNVINCLLCPLEWTTKLRICPRSCERKNDSPYKQFRDLRSSKRVGRRKRLANLIRIMFWKHPDQQHENLTHNDRSRGMMVNASKENIQM